MRRHLPARPNLEHLRTQAKTLLTKLREGDAQAAKTFAQHLPEASKLSAKQVRERGYRWRMRRPSSRARPDSPPGPAWLGTSTAFAAWKGRGRFARSKRMDRRCPLPC